MCFLCCKKYPCSLFASISQSIPKMLNHDCCWSGCFLSTAVCPNLPLCSGICLNGGYATYPLFIYSLGDKLPHLPSWVTFCTDSFCSANVDHAQQQNSQPLHSGWPAWWNSASPAFSHQCLRVVFHHIPTGSTLVAMEVPLQQLQQSLCQILAMCMFI